MKNSTEYRAEMLVILGDAGGRRYSDSMLDMGLREALTVYRTYCPQKKTTVSRISRITHNVAGFFCGWDDGMDLLMIKRKKTGEILQVNPYYENGMINFFIPGTVNMMIGEELEITLGGKHTIKGLDQAAVTTVPDTHSLTIVTGAAGYAMLIRARSVTEVFGKRPEDREALSSQANRLITDFERSMKKAALRASFHRDPWSGY